MSSSNFLTLFAGVISLVFGIVLAFYKLQYQYWRKKNVPCMKPSFPYGNLISPFEKKEAFRLRLKRYYDEAKAKDWKHCGLYSMTSPTYMPVSLEIVKHILTKDFEYFANRDVFYNKIHDPLSATLFAIEGAEWRNLRKKLTPFFTTSKLKIMAQSSSQFITALVEKIGSYSQADLPIDITEILICFTTDIMGSFVFSADCQSSKIANSPFKYHGRKLFKNSSLKAIRSIFELVFPHIAKALHFRVFPAESSNFFLNATKNTLEFRKLNNLRPKDFVQFLVDLKTNKIDDKAIDKSEIDRLSLEDIGAQCLLFFGVSIETIVTTLTFTLYELSKNQDVQNKVRIEIKTILSKYNGEQTYEAVEEMKYLDQMLKESLRKHPSLGVLVRKCVKDYKIPGDDLTIKKGTHVLIPSHAIHYDEEYWPNPNQFDPERFNEENKGLIKKFSLLSFGEGPRNCIGMRFGSMQSKMILVALLDKYQFSVHPTTIEPMQIKAQISLAPVDKIWLSAKKV